MAFCEYCGSALSSSAVNFCPNCGAAVSNTNAGTNTNTNANASTYTYQTQTYTDTASQQQTSDTAKTILTAAGTAAGVSLLGNLLFGNARRYPTQRRRGIFSGHIDNRPPMMGRPPRGGGPGGPHGGMGGHGGPGGPHGGMGGPGGPRR